MCEPREARNEVGNRANCACRRCRWHALTFKEFYSGVVISVDIARCAVLGDYFNYFRCGSLLVRGLKKKMCSLFDEVIGMIAQNCGAYEG